MLIKAVMTTLKILQYMEKTVMKNPLVLVMLIKPAVVMNVRMLQDVEMFLAPGSD